MPNFTPRLNLIKPLVGESFSVEHANGNADKIEAGIPVKTNNAQAIAGTNDVTFVTPLALRQVIDSIILLPTNQDIDLLRGNKAYFGYSGTVTGIPGIADFVLYGEGGSISGSQTLISIDPSSIGVIFTRTLYSGIWTPWYRDINSRDKATQAQAIAMTDDTTYMTPLRTADSIKEKVFANLTLNIGSNATRYVKIAQGLSSIPTGVNSISLNVNGIESLSDNDIGIDEVTMSTRPSIKLSAKNIKRTGIRGVSYGYVNNAITGNAELWVRLIPYNRQCVIQVKNVVGFNLQNIQYLTVEPTGINYVNVDEVMDSSYVFWIGNATGTNTLSTTYANITSYTQGLAISFSVATNTTVAATLRVNSLAYVPILNSRGTAVANLRAGGVYTVRYSGTNFILQGEGGEYGTATASQVLAPNTFGTESGVITGTLPNRGIFNLGSGVTVPPGYYSGGTTDISTPFSSGSATLSNQLFNISGLSFRPNSITVWSLDAQLSSNFNANRNSNMIIGVNGQSGYNAPLTNFGTVINNNGFTNFPLVGGGNSNIRYEIFG